jgi:hypothetical protein
MNAITLQRVQPLLRNRQRKGKHVPVATNTHTRELLFETVFFTLSMQRGYKEENWGDRVTQFI